MGKKLHNGFLIGIKREFKLPDVLSIEEVKLVISLIANLVHKAIISLIYSFVLRIIECINLKTEDIDSKRMLIKIVQAKGKKAELMELKNF